MSASFVAAPVVACTVCVTDVRPDDEYVIVYVVPFVPLIPRPENVRTPALALAVAVPTSVAPVDTDAVIDAVEFVTTLPEASCTCTTGCVLNAAPDAAVTPDIELASTSFAAAPYVTDTVASWVTAGREPDVKLNEYEPATPRMPRPLNVTTPFVGYRAAVPMSAPSGDPAAIDAVTTSVLVVTTLPATSTTRTTGCVENSEPDATVLLDDVVICSAAAGPARRTIDCESEAREPDE